MRFPPVHALIRSLYAFSIPTAARTRVTSAAFSRALLPAAPRPTPSSYATSMPILSFLGSFFGSSARDNMSYPVQKSDEEWRAVLSPEQFRVLRKQGTEAPYTGEYDKHMPKEGVYTCAGCSAPLYKAEQKFKTGCGWPAFFDTIPGAVTRHVDSSFGMERTEIVCSNCGGHLGHVFKGEGYPTPTDERHCVNSVSLKFSEDAKEGKEASKV